MTPRIARVVWILVGLCLPALVQADPVKFISSGEKAYAEVTLDRGVHKLYTEWHGDFKALMVFGERNNPELLKISFIDASKTIVTFKIAFRTDEKTASPGSRIDNEFVQSLSSDADGLRSGRRGSPRFPRSRPRA